MVFDLSNISDSEIRSEIQTIVWRVEEQLTALILEKKEAPLFQEMGRHELKNQIWCLECDAVFVKGAVKRYADAEAEDKDLNRFDCHKCGELVDRFAKKCNNCGHEFTEEFCVYCGHLLCHHGLN